MTRETHFRKKQLFIIIFSFLTSVAFIMIYGCGGEWRGLQSYKSSGVLISLSPTSINFGSIPVGNSSTSTITIYNEGSEDLSISDMSLTDTENFELDVNGGEAPCNYLNPIIPSGESRTIAVVFSPNSSDTCSAILAIGSDSPESTQGTVSLTGTGFTEPAIVASPTNHNFGTIEAGSQSEPIEISIANAGTENLYISEIILSETDAYLLDLSGGQYPIGSTETPITPGQVGTLTVAFAPGYPGTFTGELNIVSNDPDNGTVSIQVSGIGENETIPDRSVTLSWEAPTTNIDGTPVTDLAGFRIHVGSSSGNYTDSIDVGYTFSHTMEELPPGTMYFSVTAYDEIGNESDFSNEGSKTFN